jgi:hypothetical protein
VNGDLGWTIGIEVELIAPAGLSRRDVAQEVAKRHGGSVHRLFHHQAEPSTAKGVPIFETLMPGFEARDRHGRRLGTFIDDLTLQTDLHREAQPKPGWYRIASDDVRLLRLIDRHVNPEAPLEAVLDPVATLLGGTVDEKEGGIRRLSDSEGSPIALAAPLPGERERACEIVTPPIATDHFAALDTLLQPARDLGFGLPHEGAVHIHFDGRPLQDAGRLQRIIRRLEDERDALRISCATNPACRRLGPQPPAVLDIIFADDFATLPWSTAAARLAEAGPTKYCDFNMLNLLGHKPNKLTLEIRILGPSLDTAWILDRARQFRDIIAASA